MQEKGINLLDQAFEQVTDKQIETLPRSKQAHLQRCMDSTQVASNIRQMGRVQLLVEVLQRVQRMLNESRSGSTTQKPLHLTCGGMPGNTSIT